jgi:hypothetical protein
MEWVTIWISFCIAIFAAVMAALFFVGLVGALITYFTSEITQNVKKSGRDSVLFSACFLLAGFAVTYCIRGSLKLLKKRSEAQVDMPVESSAPAPDPGQIFADNLGPRRYSRT